MNRDRQEPHAMTRPHTVSGLGAPRSRSRAAPIVALALFACSAIPVAFATLGGDANSIDADQMRIHAQTGRLTQGTTYSVRELQLSGTLVHEYLSATNKVFAVSWRGRSVPDLRTLLGDRYFQSYIGAAMAGPHNRHQLSVRQEDLVVQSGGHMREYFGRAYVPSLLPSGFSVNEIQ